MAEFEIKEADTLAGEEAPGTNQRIKGDGEMAGAAAGYAILIKPLDILASVEKNMSMLDSSLARIITKQSEIDKVNDGFSKKTMLYSEEHKEQLKFQSSLLDNEKHYLAGLKRNFMTKMTGDLFDLSGSVSMLATSIITLEVSTDDKNDILKRIANVKRVQEANFKVMASIVSAICQNLEFIKNYLLTFDAHISTIHQKLKVENFHCHNIESHITHKRQQIGIEYDRYMKTLNLHMDYYNRLSTHIATQIPHMQLLSFCIE